ncbi:MAG TPA: ATP-binding protein [Anaerolineales bacterium]|nr:ATP-binding protein [Anaerolineales bacterium]
MGELFNQILQALNSPLGSVVYHILLVSYIATSFQSALNHWRLSEFPQARRTMFGLGLLLTAQLFLFAFSGLGWQGFINPTASLPPLDRAFTLASILWVTWLWAFPEPSRPADAATIILSLLIAAVLALSLLTWAPQSKLTTYNATTDDFFWQVASIGLIVIGALLLLIRRPNGFANGLTFLGLAFLGHISRFVFNEAGNYSGLIRLAYLAAFPILPTLAQRFPAPFVEQEVKVTSVKQDTPIPERRRYSTDPKTFHALLSLAAESSAPKVSQAITRAIAQTMLADLCFLVYLTDNKNQLVIASGYDLIREENLDGGSLNKGTIPMLANAIQRGRPLRLPASSTSADIKGLSEALGLSSPGHILSVPIVTPEKDNLGGVILLSPYSNRLWSAEDQAFLTNIASSLVPIVERSQRVSKLEQQGEQNRQAVETARSQIADLERRNDELSRQIEAMNFQSEQDAGKSESYAALLAAQEDSQRTIQQLQEEIFSLRGADQQSESQMEQELKVTLKEVAKLQNQLAETNVKMLEMEKGEAPGQQKSGEQAEVIASISQELRQPMSSIIGYTDLLLGESVGILGALQRKFVERIKASTERIRSMIDDMIQVSTLETGLGGLKTEAVDLNTIIDNAMTYTSSQVREKNIAMQLELPKKSATVNADREALQQILIHLLQNAGASTPVEGTIRLKVQTTDEGDQPYVMIQVADSGGGIPADDLPRVFTRLYRADNVLIQGVGDTGVGLSIAKTLTEAQHGRIWVESEPGVGATFSVLLPLAKESPDNHARKDKK